MSIIRLLLVASALLVVLSGVTEAARYHRSAAHLYMQSAPRAYGYAPGHFAPRSGTGAAARFQNSFENTY